MKNDFVFTFLLLLLTAGCNSNEAASGNDADGTEEGSSKIPIINYAVTASFPHDTNSYTEGLLVHNGQLYESTGFDSAFPNTQSLFGTVNLQTGKISSKAELDKHRYFGEGIVFLNDKIYQLTYTSKIGFIYDARNFKKTGEFKIPSEQGWGMTTDGTYLIMSDGTSKITWLNPPGFEIIKTISVTDENGPVARINELEMINGFIYANIYLTNNILRIDTANGNVTGKLNLSSLADEAGIRYAGSQQLNGIAYDSVSKKTYVTGKCWPTIYEITFGH